MTDLQTIQAPEGVTARMAAEREWGADVIVVPPDHDTWRPEEVCGYVQSSFKDRLYKAVRVKKGGKQWA